MSRASAARSKKRRESRVMKAAGVAAMHRITIENSAISAALAKGASLPDFLSFNVSAALDALSDQRADMLGRVVVTMGPHPDFPNAITIEAKAAAVLPDPDPGCPIDHSLDAAEDEEADERDDAGS